MMVTIATMTLIRGSGIQLCQTDVRGYLSVRIMRHLSKIKFKDVYLTIIIMIILVVILEILLSEIDPSSNGCTVSVRKPSRLPAFTESNPTGSSSRYLRFPR